MEGGGLGEAELVGDGANGDGAVVEELHGHLILRLPKDELVAGVLVLETALQRARCGCKAMGDLVEGGVSPVEFLAEDTPHLLADRLRGDELGAHALGLPLEDGAEHGIAAGDLGIKDAGGEDDFVAARAKEDGAAEELTEGGLDPVGGVGEPDLGELQVDAGNAGEPNEEDRDGELCREPVCVGVGGEEPVREVCVASDDLEPTADALVEEGVYRMLRAIPSPTVVLRTSR